MTGWFDGGADGAELALRAAFVSVLPAAGGGDVAGGGVYLRDRYLLTCAHVVNAALGRDMFSMGEPGPGPVRVAFAASADRRRVVLATRVSAWMPPRRRDGGQVRKGDVAWLGDLAVLELTAEPPESVLPQRWQEMVRDQRVRAWYGAGQAASAADTTVQVCEPPVAYLDAAPTGPGIVGGYSGSPLWSYADQAVVGLAVGRLQSDGPAGRGYDERTFAFSWQAIRTELRRELGVDRASRVLPPAQAAPVRRRIDGLSQLADLVRVLLPTEAERERSAQYLAREFGLPGGPQGTAPEPERFAVLLLEQPRALAALAEALAKHSADDAHRLLDVGRALAAPGLLSPGQHQWLLTVLDEVFEPAGPGRSVLPSTEELLRAALPVVRAPAHLLAAGGRPPEGFPSRHAALVHHLEGYLGAPLGPAPGVRRVPLLLRYVEHLAAVLVAGQPDRARKDQAERLRTWSGRVAQQLGVGEAALSERRAAAEEWAAGRPAGAAAGNSRVAIRLTRYQHGGHGTAGRFRSALWTDFGDGRLRPVAAADDRPHTPEEVARQVREIVAAWGDGEPADGDEDVQPALEFFLDEEELDLSVEDWDSSYPDDPDDPDGAEEVMPLGIAHPVVVRLAAALGGVRAKERERALERRWRHHGTVGPLHLDERHHEPKHVVSAVVRHRNAAWVVLRGADPARRPGFAARCLRLGIPVVLWDRAARGAAPADHFDALHLDGPAAELPERVRRYRANVYGYADQYPLRPVLAWEDPTRPAPALLHLADPDEEPAGPRRPGPERDGEGRSTGAREHVSRSRQQTGSDEEGVR